MQLFLHDDDSFEFRSMPMESTCLIEKKDGEEVAAYKHYFKSEYFFEGYKGIPSDMVTLGYPRDIILELHDILDEDEKPPRDGNLSSPFITAIAENRCYKLESQMPKGLLADKVVMTLLIIAVLFAIFVGIKALL